MTLKVVVCAELTPIKRKILLVIGSGQNATTSIGADSSTSGAREYADGGYETDETTGSTALATYAPASGAA